MNLVLEYIHYRWKAKQKSKFSSETSDRIKNCITQSNVKLAFETELLAYRNAAKQENRTILVQDFGAGSKKMGATRTIQNIYKNSRSTTPYQRILHNLVCEFNCKSILEMGTSLGFTSIYLSKANVSGKVTTIEACENTAAEAEKLFIELQLTKIELIHSTFLDYFEKREENAFDLVFIDGHHDGKALLGYMDFLAKSCKANCIFILDDIRWSKEMLAAWNELISRPEFIFHHDLFRMGILIMK
jgi:predicted O-methyltransferase YrrM